MSRIQEFDFSVNLLQSILWQYNDALKIQSLLNQKQDWYNTNQTAFWQNWYNNVFNLLTANNFGLSVWAVLLQVPLYVSTDTEPTDAPFLGFNAFNPTYPDLINTYWNFGGADGTTGANFSDRGTEYILSTEQQRVLLRLRYFQLTSRGAIPEINSFLNYLAATSPSDVWGNAWVLDLFNMNMRYVFDFNISPQFLQVLLDLDILPRPAAVGLQYYVTNDQVWGFDTKPATSGNENFNNGNFIPDSFFS